MSDRPPHPADSASLNIRVQLREFKIPPIQDALVLGKEASVGSEAMLRSLTLLHVAPFEHIHLEGNEADDVVSDILVRRSVLKKVPRRKLIDLILNRIKPFMTAEEILHLEVDAQVSIDQQE